MKTELRHLMKPTEVIENENGRFYVIGGQKYPSVTTVLGYRERDKWTEWRENNKSYMNRILDRGSDMHERIEKHLLGESPGDYSVGHPEGYILYKQILPLLSPITNVVGLEKFLYSTELRVAGRADCIAEYNNEPAIIDFKTSTRKKSVDEVYSYFKQATCYAKMYEERTGVKIPNIVILMSCADGEIEVFQEDPDHYIDDVREDIEYYYSQNKMD